MINIIGLKVEVLKSANNVAEGKKAIVVDETASTIVLDIGGKQKRIFKKKLVLKNLFDGSLITEKDMKYKLSVRLKKKNKGDAR